MKCKIRFVANLLWMAFILFAATLFGLNSESAAQTLSTSSSAAAQDKNLLPPSAEQFREVSEQLLVPWRSGGCNLNHEAREPDCYYLNNDQWLSADVLTLYNANGSLWYRFSLTYASPDYFLRNKEKSKEFSPLALYPDNSSPSTVILRLVGESENWYKVEVNEETQTTKYVLKGDPMWAKSTWDYWLYIDYRIYLHTNPSPLRDKPNGQIIEETANLALGYVGFIRREGDWALVEAASGENEYRGWVRWREGRNILVGCAFNVKILRAILGYEVIRMK